MRPRVWLGGAILSLGVWGPTPACAASQALYQFELGGLNRSYPQPVGELPPILLDPLAIRWRSPDAVVELVSHRARLWERPDGKFDGEVEAEFQGRGTLILDFEGLGLAQRLTDAVEIPRQRVRLPGTVRLEKVPSGYRVRAEGVPQRVQIELRSRLVDQALQLCRGAAVLTFGALDCNELARSMTRPAVALPSEFETTIPEADLLPSDRIALDRLTAPRFASPETP